MDATERPASCSQAERQRDGAAEIRGRIPGKLIDGEVVVRYALEKPPHRHFSDHARHLVAQAEMLASAEPEMVSRASIDVVLIGTGEFALIAIARSVGQRHLVARLECLTVQFHIAHDGAPES